jgi:putative transposase
MSKPREFEINNYYHIYSRGVNKCSIFLEDSDYKRFQKNITTFNKKTSEFQENRLVHIISYCLMPNHFHFIIKEVSDGGTSLFFQKILTGYALYFNKKYNRTGSLFGSRFKYKLIDSDIYFKHLLNYVSYNPIKLINRKYSSVELLNGNFKLTMEEIKFVENYPYKFQAPTSRSELGV